VWVQVEDVAADETLAPDAITIALGICASMRKQTLQTPLLVTFSGNKTSNSIETTAIRESRTFVHLFRQRLSLPLLPVLLPSFYTFLHRRDPGLFSWSDGLINLAASLMKRPRSEAAVSGVSHFLSSHRLRPS
jgi:hypothetical protein